MGFRDFLLVYNRIAEYCFAHCIENLNDRSLSDEEIRCVDVCCGKQVNLNHKLMSVYMEEQPKILEKRIQEVQKLESAQQTTT
ncbi:unnamed protein product [Darwinula stevensoni]|uniref:Mitochondrial import inner membrane translocase subunit n=1 Tax=Darwinula stevensoni TaxID=69355 RepID=A0A7R9A7R9_9CRUS|nr:unnamed protein product [Darwinula stevensoni]CAG0893187.1 unnamed protein product [Darwinula stevensoni]